MGAPTPSMPQNPTNQPMQQPQSGGKGGGKGMSGSGMATPPISQANTSAPIDQGYRSTLQDQSTPQPQAGGGKGFAGNDLQPNQNAPDGSNMTLSATSGQPQTGQPNAYANTTGSWDNQSNQQSQAQMGGKGKGA